MHRGRVAGYVLLLLMFLCHVQSQRIVRGDTIVDPKNIWTPELGTNGNTSSVGDHHAQWWPSAVPTTGPLTPSSSLRRGGRTRRNGFNNATEGDPGWVNEFAIYPIIIDNNLMGESEDFYIDDELDILKDAVQSVDLKILKPKGLRIFIPDGNTTFTILKSYINLNEAVETSVGDFATSTNRTVGGWTILAPELEVEPGDEVHYQIHALLDKQLHVAVDGVFGIEGEIPRVSGSSSELVQLCPSKCISLWTEAHDDHQMTLSETLRWSHRFTVVPATLPYPGVFTKKSANKWVEDMHSFKSSFENKIDFEFVNPTGLRIIIPGESGNISEFNIKVGEDFLDLDTGHYVANVTEGMHVWSYYFQNLNVKDGAKIYYWMRTTYNGSWDCIIRGELEVTYDNCTRGSSVGLYYASLCPINTFKEKDITYLALCQHYFSIYNNYNTMLQETFTTERWEDARALNNIMKNHIDMKMFSPKGLWISISGGNDNFLIADFNMQLDEEFNHIDYNLTSESMTALGYSNVWRYYYPHFNAHAGLKVYYWMRVIFGENMRISIVKGVFVIRHPLLVGGGGTVHIKPFLRVRGFQSHPSSIAPTTFVGDLPGGTVEGAFRWSNRFTLTAPSDARFTNESAKKWLEDGKKFKKILENDFYFTFLNSTCFNISIPGNKKYYNRDTFEMKLNGQPVGPLLLEIVDPDYSYLGKEAGDKIDCSLRVKAGDKIEYSMKLSLIKHIVKGQLEILGL